MWSSKDMQQVIDLERALLTPHVRSSRQQLDDLLDPDFTEIGASGRLWTRTEMVTALVNADRLDEPITAEEFQAAEIAPGLVLLTYVCRPTRPCSASDFPVALA